MRFQGTAGPPQPSTVDFNVDLVAAKPLNTVRSSGSAVYNAAQLKTIQEVITLLVFAGFSYAYLKEPLTWSQGFGFALIAAGAFFVFHKW